MPLMHKGPQEKKENLTVPVNTLQREEWQA